MGSNNPVFQFQLSSTPRSGLDSRLDCQLESRVNFGKYFNLSSVTFVHGEFYQTYEVGFVSNVRTLSK